MAKKKSGGFVFLTRELLRDPDYRKLTSGAKVAYTYLRAKRNYDNEYVTLSYREIYDVLSFKAFNRAIDELVRAGFIFVNEDGLHRMTHYTFNKDKHGVFNSVSRKNGSRRSGKGW